MSPNSYASTSTLPSSQEEDLFTLKIQGIDVAEMPTRQRMTTDSVRLYLQDIGRVPLLAKEEEVSKAQQIQRYMALVEKRNTAVENKDPEILAFVKVLTIHDQLVSHIGHRPSIERWAKTANLTVTQLRRTLATGKKKWSQLTNLTVKELEQVEKEGTIAKEQMINANLRLVVSIAKKYQNRGLELLDLIQEGTLGLERAVEKFDPTKGYRFSTYSYWWIRQGITRALATQSRMIRLPVHITEKLNKIKKIQRQVSQEKGRMPTVTEIAQELEITAEQVKEVLTKVPRSVSLEIKVGKDQDTELVDLLETEDLSPEESLMNESLRRDLHNLLLDLTKREREVIELRYGFGDGTSYSLADIGRNLELSRERVRQIEAKALQKLRQPRRRNLIRDYFEALT
ncbi:MAG: RNA polymerase sigma factor SigC [Microcystaceae cyanobacterium]